MSSNSLFLIKTTVPLTFRISSCVSCLRGKTHGAVGLRQPLAFFRKFSLERNPTMKTTVFFACAASLLLLFLACPSTASAQHRHYGYGKYSQARYYQEPYRYGNEYGRGTRSAVEVRVVQSPVPRYPAPVVYPAYLPARAACWENNPHRHCPPPVYHHHAHGIAIQSRGIGVYIP